MADNQAGDIFRKQPPVQAGQGTIQRNDEAWGGHGYGRDPVTGLNTGANGYDEDTARYQGMAQAAANQQAYQNNYGQANFDQGMGGMSRGMQQNAFDITSDVANNGSSIAYRAGQAQLQAGAMANQAAAASARGGSLAQAAAMQQQQAGQGAYMQQGQQQLDAQRAMEQQQAEQQLMQQGAAMRAGDQQAQGLLQQQADAQAANEQAQRGLNDSTSMAYEQMGADVNKAELQGQTNDYALAGQHDSARAAADQADQDRTAQRYAAYGSAGGTLFGKLGSDERMKSNTRYMLSDDRTKLAKAWDEGHNEALNKVQQYRMMSPAELKQLGEKGNRLANAVRGAKADAYDEGQGRPQHIMEPPPERQMQSFTREQPPPPNMAAAAAQQPAPPPPPPAAVMPPAAAMRTSMLSDERTKSSHAEGEMGHALESGLRPFEYEYKPEFQGAERQGAHEKNIGPMAQDMASNPITGTAIKHGDNGLLYIDQPKALKLALGGIGYLAAKQREMQDSMKKGGR